MNASDRALCTATLRALSNPEGINQYTGGGGRSERDHKIDEGTRVRVRGNGGRAAVHGEGKVGTAHPTGSRGFYSLKDSKGNHRGYFHESDLRVID